MIKNNRSIETIVFRHAKVRFCNISFGIINYRRNYCVSILIYGKGNVTDKCAGKVITASLTKQIPCIFNVIQKLI